MALGMLRDDGEHAPVYFLCLPSGQVTAHPFDGEAERPVGHARAQLMCEAVESSGANAVAFISEAWQGKAGHGPPGDNPESEDVLLTAGLARDGAQVTLCTPIHRRADGSTDVGETSADQLSVATFDPIRAYWGLADDAR